MKQRATGLVLATSLPRTRRRSFAENLNDTFAKPDRPSIPRRRVCGGAKLLIERTLRQVGAEIHASEPSWSSEN